MRKYIYVLHEYGSPIHYHALKYLAEQNGYSLKFYTFQRILEKDCIKLLKNIKRYPLQSFKDALFLCSLPFIKKSKIVIGIAPYNRHLSFLVRLTKKHEVYYHTSYSCWDGTRFAYEPISSEQKKIWIFFTSRYVKHIFAVSDWTKKQLVMNGYATCDRVSVVNHSYTKMIKVDQYKEKSLNFICVAVLEEYKGISELLTFFRNHPEANITFVGKGSLASKVSDYSNKYSNINYVGYVKGAENIVPYYKENSFLILNSHRKPGWEELFGMAIIEGMSCGCVPITTNHPGPQEIIQNNEDGIICLEGKIEEGIERAIQMNNSDYQKMKQAALKTSERYYYINISERWRKILP